MGVDSVRFCMDLIVSSSNTNSRRPLHHEFSAMAAIPSDISSLLMIIEELVRKLEQSESDRVQLQKEVRDLKLLLDRCPNDFVQLRGDEEAPTIRTTTENENPHNKVWKRRDRWATFKAENGLGMPPRRKSDSSLLPITTKDSEKAVSYNTPALRSCPALCFDYYSSKSQTNKRISSIIPGVLTPRRTRSCSVIEMVIPEEPESEEEESRTISSDDEVFCSPMKESKKMMAGKKKMLRSSLLQSMLSQVQPEIGGTLREEGLFSPSDGSSSCFDYDVSSSEELGQLVGGNNSHTCSAASMLPCTPPL